MADSDEWTCDYRDAFTITLVEPQADGLKQIATFQPKHTQAIFGDDESVYGWKNLSIQLRYRANDMRPHLQVSGTKKKLDATSEFEVPNVKEIMEDGVHLPRIAFVRSSDFEESSKAVGSNWCPPGTLYKSMEAGDVTYEVWKGLLNDEKVKQLVRRVQILAPLFIESGTYIIKEEENSTEIDEDYDRWTVFFLYRRDQQGTYTFIGFSTIYRFFYFQPSKAGEPKPPLELPEEGKEISLESLPSRSRLAQFVILPPFQGQGNGPRLYNTIFEYYYKDQPSTLEFAIEDPNEAFDDLRDLCDLTFLRTVPEFLSLRLNTELKITRDTEMLPKDLVVGVDTIDAIRKKSKIVPRQFLRVLEMHLMSKLPDSVRPTIEAGMGNAKSRVSQADKHAQRLWQLYVKSRLYRQHRHVLAELEIDVRLDKLDETLRNVEFEYARLFAMYEKWPKHGSSGADPNGKRKLDVDGAAEDQGPGKKARVEDAMEE